MSQKESPPPQGSYYVQIDHNARLRAAEFLFQAGYGWWYTANEIDSIIFHMEGFARFLDRLKFTSAIFQIRCISNMNFIFLWFC